LVGEKGELKMNCENEPENLNNQEPNDHEKQKDQVSDEAINPPRREVWGIQRPDNIKREVKPSGLVGSWPRFSTKNTLALGIFGAVLLLSLTAVLTGNLVFAGVITTSGLGFGLKRVIVYHFPEPASRKQFMELWFELQKLKLEKRSNASKNNGNKRQP
jgi:hypothetical protein